MYSKTMPGALRCWLCPVFGLLSLGDSVVRLYHRCLIVYSVTRLSARSIQQVSLTPVTPVCYLLAQLRTKVAIASIPLTKRTNK